MRLDAHMASPLVCYSVTPSVALKSLEIPDRSLIIMSEKDDTSNWGLINVSSCGAGKQILHICSR